LSKDSLSITNPSDQHQADVIFDGKPHPDHGSLDSTTTSKRLNTLLIQMEDRRKGVLIETEDYKLSEDAKTLTIVSKEAISGAVFTTIWDKK
jgi:hypothetical protein